MVTVTIGTEDKAIKRLPEMKKLRKKKFQQLPFKQAEEALHAIFTSMSKKNIQAGTVHFELFFNGKEAETSEIPVSITPYYPLLEELIRKDINESEDENTTQLQERLNRELLEAIAKEVNETDDVLKISETRNPKSLSQVKGESEEISKQTEYKESTEEPIEKQEEKELVPTSTVDEEDDTVDFSIIDGEESKEVENKTIPTVQNKKQRLLDSYESYINVAIPEEIITETKQKCSEEQLVELQDLVVVQDKEVEQRVKEQVVEFLRRKKQANRLREEIKAYEESIKVKAGAIQNQLSTYYKEVSADKPETYAETHLDETFESARNEYKLKYTNFELERDERTNKQLAEKEKEKKQEIKRAQERIEESYQQIINDLTEKNEQAKADFKKMCIAELEAGRRDVFQALVSQKMLENETALVEGKQKGEQVLKETVESYSLNTLATCQSLIDEIKEEVIQAIPEWENQALKEKEIRLKESEEQRKRDEAKKSQEQKAKELAIEEEKIALKKKELEIPKVPTVQVIPVPTSQQTAPVDSSTKDLEELVKTLISEKKEEPKVDKLSTWKTVGLSFLCFAVLGGLVGFAYDNNQTKQKLQETQQELALSVKATTSSSEKEEIDSLEQLLKERKFEAAFNHYTDKQSLKEMEAYFVETEDLPNLRKFNEQFSTTTGKLNEAILTKDNKKIIEQYEAIKEKKELTNQEKSSVKLAYFNENKADEAKKVDA